MTKHLRVPTPLVPLLRADAAMNRLNRMAVAIAMHEDGFTLRDIARVVSIRLEQVMKIRKAIDVPAGPSGWYKYNRHHPTSSTSRRSLELIARSLACVRIERLPDLCAKLQIGVISGYGIRRSVDYSLGLQARPDVPSMYRCIKCDHLSPAHPCAHCGATWLVA